jgi:preprotein translocase subunit SecA
MIAAREEYTRLYEKFKTERAEEQQKVVEIGGLHIIGSERHESRRIDNQLRGRSGRQGDPGSTQFFISMEDELLRLFGGERMQSIVEKLGVEEGQPIEAGMLTRSIENAQKKVEGRNFATRKYVLQYDNVMNKQREVIYGDRRKVLEGESMRDRVISMCSDMVEEAVENAVMGSKFSEEWDFEHLNNTLHQISRAYTPASFSEDELRDLTPGILTETLTEKMLSLYEDKENEIGENIRELERMILLSVIDSKWMDHIDAMDQLRHGIGLRALGQQDPAVAYAQEGFDMFELMTESIKEDTVRYCYGVTVATKADRKQIISDQKEVKEESASDYVTGGGNAGPPKRTEVPEREAPKEPVRRTEATVGRNDPCPCGSGKKYKYCHGK